ncbi:4e8498ae-56c6-4467-bf83-ccfc34cb2f59 [Thermothielavioides terrestris]|uniref:4e8498ae-56c6-4467-bf83-ccfc34cb2f59 n=1 Tax=Thermothielavioides terrestris TaxID=2587410 RepID=A0A446BV12_9PEZI|nr:4e8498ae-56c6-4467-bf83-ccfc34cb2f59 [Thermothielavioides terrestris]
MTKKERNALKEEGKYFYY